MCVCFLFFFLDTTQRTTKMNTTPTMTTTALTSKNGKKLNIKLLRFGYFRP